MVSLKRAQKYYENMFLFYLRCGIWGSTDCPQQLTMIRLGLWQRGIILPAADNFCNFMMFGILGTLRVYINVRVLRGRTSIS